MKGFATGIAVLAGLVAIFSGDAAVQAAINHRVADQARDVFVWSAMASAFFAGLAR